MTDGLAFVVMALLIGAVVVGIWFRDHVVNDLVEVPPEPLDEVIALRMALDELAHETRVQMIRVTRDALRDASGPAQTDRPGSTNC